jgi:hypothetical protein
MLRVIIGEPRWRWLRAAKKNETEGDGAHPVASMRIGRCTDRGSPDAMRAAILADSEHAAVRFAKKALRASSRCEEREAAMARSFAIVPKRAISRASGFRGGRLARGGNLMRGGEASWAVRLQANAIVSIRGDRGCDRYEEAGLFGRSF